MRMDSKKIFIIVLSIFIIMIIMWVFHYRRGLFEFSKKSYIEELQEHFHEHKDSFFELQKILVKLKKAAKVRGIYYYDSIENSNGFFIRIRKDDLASREASVNINDILHKPKEKESIGYKANREEIEKLRKYYMSDVRRLFSLAEEIELLSAGASEDKFYVLMDDLSFAEVFLHYTTGYYCSMSENHVKKKWKEYFDIPNEKQCIISWWESKPTTSCANCKQKPTDKDK